MQTASLGWTKPPTPPPSLPLSHRIEFLADSSSTAPASDTPSNADMEAMWDAYDFGMVMLIQNDEPQFRFNSCFALTPSTLSLSFPHVGSYVHADVQGQWLIDSGASNHYTASRHILTNYRSIPDIQIMTGKGLITSHSMGNFTLHTSIGRSIIHDVMWVLELTGQHNLLNIPQLITKHCTIQMTIDGLTIRAPTRDLMLEGLFNGKSFLVKMSTCTSFM